MAALDPALGHTLGRLHATVLQKRRLVAQAEAEGVTGADLQVCDRRERETETETGRG